MFAYGTMEGVPYGRSVFGGFLRRDGMAPPFFRVVCVFCGWPVRGAGAARCPARWSDIGRGLGAPREGGSKERS